MVIMKKVVQTKKSSKQTHTRAYRSTNKIGKSNIHGYKGKTGAPTVDNAMIKWTNQNSKNYQCNPCLKIKIILQAKKAFPKGKK